MRYSNLVNGTSSPTFNVYPPIYTPLEVAVVLCIIVTTPTTLINLYRRHTRKQAMRRASAMLLKAVTVTSQAVATNEHTGMQAVREHSMLGVYRMQRVYSMQC